MDEVANLTLPHSRDRENNLVGIKRDNVFPVWVLCLIPSLDSVLIMQNCCKFLVMNSIEVLFMIHLLVAKYPPFVNISPLHQLTSVI